MAADLKRGILIWVLGFLTFLSGIGALDALVMWELKGEEYIFNPYLFGVFFGEISANTYFWASIGLTFFLLGLTAVVGYLRLPPHPHILQRLSKLEGDIASNETMLESIQVGLFQRLEQNQLAIDGITKTVKTSLNDAENQIQSVLGKQGKSVREVFSRASNSIEREFADMKKTAVSMLENHSAELEKIQYNMQPTIEKVLGTKEELVNELKNVAKLLRDVERSTDQSVTGLQWRITKIEEKMTGLTDIKEKLEILEMRLAMPEANLTSQDASENIRGINPSLVEGLKNMGVTRVSEFLTLDAATIAEKTRFPRAIIKKLQTKAQLLMVPGVADLDAELLEEIGIASRRELADQDPFELARRIAAVSKTYIEQGKMLETEQPTIEEVWSWIRYSKL